MSRSARTEDSRRMYRMPPVCRALFFRGVDNRREQSRPLPQVPDVLVGKMVNTQDQYMKRTDGQARKSNRWESTCEALRPYTITTFICSPPHHQTAAEAKMWVPVLYLGGNARKPSREVGGEQRARSVSCAEAAGTRRARGEAQQGTGRDQKVRERRELPFVAGPWSRGRGRAQAGFAVGINPTGAQLPEGKRMDEHLPSSASRCFWLDRRLLTGRFCYHAGENLFLHTPHDTAINQISNLAKLL
ncbi:uncharacterized protein LOC130836018 isoform X2 [Hippopotamus amphibius kiboko]|uniref:uncharacterized protein LOC130836018 isoform X2 n=1 Tax=Hippopotamus amphibius kiboko TaxID=575201 RepID=UPI00259569A6|nr:uncharacterized protein LOC130836018 isoform X2 [Hippopotamus amphibius kiboko]